MRKTMIVLISLAFLMAACLPGQSPQDVQGQVETAVAQTMQAQDEIENAVALTVQAQQTLASPTAADTPTLVPTSTPLLFPTLTPIVATVTPIPSGGGGGGGGVVKAQYSCDIIHQRPFDNSEIIHGGDFDIKWTILNNGTKTWDPGVDVKYYSGPHMTDATRVEIPVAMKPGDQYDIVLDAAAPEEKGFQVMTWVVDGQYCYPYVAIIVK